ncbi:MAG TPA: TVP38/TMEM64 family protein, partial [Thermodesulfobacteriota bacterium]|nr:TVP38/TMEM64 family protein [Thermodesulfobacteriota bacterium]
GNIERLKAVILSCGMWAPVISASLMVAQSVVLFLPAFPIFVVNALVFGPVWGALLSWGSAVAGSVLCFSIAKSLGRPVVLRLVNRVHLETADRALQRYEKYVILVFGFIPVISFDVISYASGLTILTFRDFFLLVCVAQVPSALFYTLFVHRIDRGTLDVYWIVAAVLFFLLGIAGLVVRRLLSRKTSAGSCASVSNKYQPSSAAHTGTQSAAHTDTHTHTIF